MRGVDLVRRFLQTGRILPNSNLNISTLAKRQGRIPVHLRNSGSCIPKTDIMGVCQCQHTKNCIFFKAERTMAGHSHWQNIKHTKEANDAKNQAVIQSYIAQMKAAISSGSMNPDTNRKLASVLEKMKQANIPKADIKRYLENVTKKAGSAQTIYHEIRGPIGTIFVLECETEHVKTSRDMLNGLVKKTIGKIQENHSFKTFFDMKGMITVPVTKDMQVSNMDEYLEIAIETGAEDVILTKEDEEEGENYVLKFHCDPLILQKVAKDIEETYNLEYSSSQVELIPHNWVTIESEEDIEACRAIAKRLQAHPDFVNLFDNVSLPDD